MNYGEAAMSEKNGGSKAGVIRNDHSKEISPAGQASSSNGPGGSRKRKSVYQWYVDRKNLSQGRINRAEADAAKQSGEHKTAHDDVMKLKRQTKLLQDQFRKTIHAPFAGYAFLILIFLGICLKAHTSHPRHLTLKAAFAAAEASALPTSMYKVRSVYYNWLNNGMTHFEAPRKGKWERLDIWDDDPEVKKYAVKWVRSHLKCRKKKNKVMSAQLFMTHMNTHFAKCNIQDYTGAALNWKETTALRHMHKAWYAVRRTQSRAVREP